MKPDFPIQRHCPRVPTSDSSTIWRMVVLGCCLAGIASCALLKPREPGIGNPVNWQEVTGWQLDSQSQAWPSLLSNCIALSKKDKWNEICKAAEAIPDPDDATARQFFETWFQPYAVYGKGGSETGLITGYYEPLLYGSLTPDPAFPYPLYRSPENLLVVDLDTIYPELEDKRVRGRLDGNRVVPFYSRAEIDANAELLSGNEILWISDRDDVFFLHIQGSGRVQLVDGSTVGVGYSNQNGHPYVAIGKVLLDRGELKREEISLFSIRQWLLDHPEQAQALLDQNPSYVFFELRNETAAGPVGSLNVPLTPERSIAIDPKIVALGTPVWLTTNLPGDPDSLYQRLVIAQDTGGAITGPLRADLFWGHGEAAEWAAGTMKERGSMLVFLPR